MLDPGCTLTMKPFLGLSGREDKCEHILKGKQVQTYTYSGDLSGIKIKKMWDIQ